MGMNLDEAIEHGKEQLEIFGGEHKEFIECALDTMRKYQEMEQILDSWELGKINERQFISLVRKVVEKNGKDNR